MFYIACCNSHSVHIFLNVLGNNTGVVQIVNISSGMVEKEYSVHIGPVRYDIFWDIGSNFGLWNDVVHPSV